MGRRPATVPPPLRSAPRSPCLVANRNSRTNTLPFAKRRASLPSHRSHEHRCPPRHRHGLDEPGRGRHAPAAVGACAVPAAGTAVCKLVSSVVRMVCDCLANHGATSMTSSENSITSFNQVDDITGGAAARRATNPRTALAKHAAAQRPFGNEPPLASGRAPATCPTATLHGPLRVSAGVGGRVRGATRHRHRAVIAVAAAVRRSPASAALAHATMADTTPPLSPEATFPLVPQALFEDLKVRSRGRSREGEATADSPLARGPHGERACAASAQPAGPRAPARWR